MGHQKSWSLDLKPPKSKCDSPEPPNLQPIRAPSFVPRRQTEPVTLHPVWLGPSCHQPSRSCPATHNTHKPPLTDRSSPLFRKTRAVSEANWNSGGVRWSSWSPNSLLIRSHFTSAFLSSSVLSRLWRYIRIEQSRLGSFRFTHTLKLSRFPHVKNVVIFGLEVSAILRKGPSSCV